MRGKRGEGGFTLIELLVVIVILGILAAVVVFAVNGLSGEGVDTARETDLDTITRAEEVHAARAQTFGKYATEADLVSERLLVAESTLHDICLPPNKKQYKVVTAGTDCSTVTFP